MIETIYFDVGNVLIFVDIPRMIAQIAHCTGMAVEKTEKALFGENLRELYEKGLINTEQLVSAIRKESPKNFSTTEFTAAFSDIFTPNTALWPIIEQLKKQGIRLILLSNTSECHFHFIDARYPIVRQFDYKVLSYEVGMWKPDPCIFQTALKYAQCEPEQCFYTDDIPEFIDSARKTGLQGEIFTTVSQFKQQLIDRGCQIS